MIFRLTFRQLPSVERRHFCPLLIFLVSISACSGCFPTSGGGGVIMTTTLAPGVTTTTTTTTTASTPSGCCDVLFQNETSAMFGNGDMTFVYDSDTCRMSATITCQQPDPTLNLMAAIVANGQYMDFALMIVTFPATCVNGRWQLSDLIVTDLQCQLTTPT